jgi:hypothetical protein
MHAGFGRGYPLIAFVKGKEFNIFKNTIIIARHPSDAQKKPQFTRHLPRRVI